MTKIIIKESITNPNKGKYPEMREIRELIEYGIVNIDKPAGPTSHLVTANVSKIVGASKGGHSGTLDPGVSGVLPVAFDKATRIMEIFLKTGKEYVCLMRLHKEIDDKILNKVFDKFRGKIQQLPPVRSAVKRQLREREIYKIEILERKDKFVLFRVSCQAGTYIRKLCSDIDVLIGGAHMQELRRTRVGPFNEDNITTITEIKDNYEFWKTKKDESGLRKNIIPIEEAVSFLKKIWVLDSAVENLCNGSDLYSGGISALEDAIKKDETIAIFTLKDELVSIGTARLDAAKIKNSRSCVAKNGKVFMKLGTYR